MQKDAIIIPVTIRADFQGGGSSGGDGGGNIAVAKMNSNGSHVPKNEQDEKTKKAASKAKSAANAAGAILAKAIGQTASLAMQGYGDITGDYTTGQNLQTTVSEAGSIVAAIKLGPVGIATYGLNKAVQAYQYKSERKKSEARSKFIQQRVYGTTWKS